MGRFHLQPRLALLSAVGSVALLLLCVVPAASVGAAPGASASTALQWAYGAAGHASGSGTAQRGGTYAMNAYFGWHVVLTQTNTSATSYLLEAQRTMGIWVFVNYCYPSCASPSYTGNITAHAWESATAFANFTENGSVVVNGSSVPALALQNVFSRVVGNYSENAVAVVYGSMGHRAADRYLAVSMHATLATVFVPSLGLVPLSPTPGETWSSSANYSATGAYQWVAFNSSTALVGASSHHSWYRNGSANANGTITLTGGDEGRLILSNGASVTAILLQSGGPFDEREGFILLPAAADLFGGNPHAPSTGTASSAQVATSRIDYLPGSVGHLGLLASATSFTPASATPTANAAATGLAPMVSPTAGPSPSDSPGSSLLQAQPESVPLAQQGAGCLVSTCSAANGGGASRALLLPLLIGVGVAALVGGLVVQRRRQIPAPPRPLAALYPVVNGGPEPARPRKPSTTGPEEPSATPDPLDHLW